MDRLERERHTVAAMIALWCRARHRDVTGLCPECAELARYADQRTGNCPYGRAKPVCSRCRIHCYDNIHRDRIRTVMRYAGPRMLLSHPALALLHLLDRVRLQPPPERNST
jgi:hypothetical protein